MPTYEYVGPNDHYLNAGEQVLTPGDVVELSEDELGEFEHYFEEVEAEDGSEGDSSSEEDESPSGEDETAESEDEGAQSESEAEVADPPLDPTSLSVNQLESELDAGDFSDEELDAIEQAERDGEERTTALDAIESAR